MTIIKKPNRTAAYVFTTTDRNDPALISFRESVRIANALRNEDEPRQYVKLQARGHRYGKRQWHQALPLDKGEYWDVYVYNRW